MTAKGFHLLLSILLIVSSAKASKGDNRENEFLTEVAHESMGDETSIQSFISEVSDGLNTKDISPACDPKIFEDLVLSKKRTSSDYFKLVKDYFKRCEGELSLHSPKGVFALLKYAMFEYPFFQHPQIQDFTIKLANGIYVPAIAALKEDSRPRPLVVIKCGTFCSASESPSMKAYLMSLFDQSPFNVVLLASQTGLDYMALNHQLSLGGRNEGYEALEVGKWLKDQWIYRDRISSMHLMGISLGGNAAVFGAAYNDIYPESNGQKVFRSVTAICPVISLKPTLDHLYGATIVGRIFAKLTKWQFVDARADLHDIPDLLADERIPKKSSEMADYLGVLASTSLQRRGIASTPTSYFKSNNFWNLKGKVETPMLVWASKDDIVVNNKINAQVMEQDDAYQKSSNVGVLNLAYGSHCGFHGAYGPLAASTVLRTFVLSHSPEFLDSYKQSSMPWTFGFRKLYSVEEHVGQSFEFSAKSEEVKVSFRIFNWSGSDQCRENGPWVGSGQCVTTTIFTLPISAFKKMGARVPRNSVEAQALTREFNTKIQFKSKSNKALNGTNATDFVMVWRSNFE